MARRKKVDVLKRYQGELDRSRTWRDTETFDGLWRRMIDLYKGRHYDSLSPHDRMVVNQAFATKNVIAPSVAVNNPKFAVHARKPEDAGGAVIAEEALNYLWRAHKYKKQFRLAVDDFLITGHGWMKVGYKFRKEIELKSAALENEKGSDTETEDGVDDHEDVEGNVETEMKIVDDRPFVERISVFDIYVDPDARNTDEIRWIAQRVKRPVADVRVDSRYNAAHARKVQAAEADAHDGSKEENGIVRPLNGNSKGFVDVYEYYDLRERTVCTFVASYTEGFMIDPKPMPYGFGHPFVMLRNYEVPDEFYPMGELESIEILQHELNTTRTEMMLHRRKNARKFLYDESMLNGEGAMDAVRSDEDMTFVAVNTTGGGRLVDAVAPFPGSPIQADSYNMSEIIEGDIADITGVNDYMRGGPTANIRRTATEAAMIQDSQNARASDKLAGIEEVLAILGERLIQLLQQYMTEDQVIRMVGSESAPAWVGFKQDWIKGDFDFDVEGGSTQPINESFRAQRAMQMMDAMAPFIQMQIIDPVALARKVLQDGFGVKDPSIFFIEQGGDEMQQGMPPEGMPPEGLPPEAGPMMGAPMPQMDDQMMEPEGGIAGIPPELSALLDIEPSPVLQ